MDSHIPLDPLCIFLLWFSSCSPLIGFIIAAPCACVSSGFVCAMKQKNHPLRRLLIRGESRSEIQMFRQNKQRNYLPNAQDSAL